MTTQYTPILKLALPVTGELSGTWGTVVNDNITSMVEQAVAGLSTINTWTANAHTLTTADGTSSEARCAILVLATGAGGTAITGAGEVICPAASKLYVVKNGTSYAVTLKTSGGSGVAVPAGDTAFLFCDGTNVNACVTTIVNGHISGNLTVDGNTTLGDANTDTITATARFNTDLLPSTDNARDLGSSGNSWRTLYCDTSVLTALVTTTNLQVTNIKANDGTAALSIADTTGNITVTTQLTVDNLNLSGNTISSTDTNGNVVIAPNGTGDVYLDADTIRVGDSGANVTLTSNGAGDLILNTNGGTDSGSLTIADGVNGNITISTNGTGVTTMTTAVEMSATTQNIALGTSQTSGTFTVGGASQTGNITLDQSTKAHTLAIGTGATENGATKTINIGTNGVSGSTTTITIGSANGTTTTFNGTVNATTVNVTTLDLTNLEVTNIKAKDGTSSITLADGTGNVSIAPNVTLGDASTDTVQVNGYMGVGGAPNSQVGIRIIPSALTGVNQYGLQAAFAGSSAATTSANGLYTAVATEAASFTCVNVRGFWAANGAVGAGSTVTNKHGVYIDDQTGATNNYGITSLVTSGTNKWNIYASGTAANYFAGDVGIGNSNITDFSGRVLAINTTAGAARIKLTTATSGTASTDGAGITFDTSNVLEFINRESDGVIKLSTNSLERMRIDSSGNVGIGTSSPTNLLSVAGNANVTGNVTLGDATTDTVTVNGYIGVGGAPGASTAVTVAPTALTGTLQYGVSAQPTGTSAATNSIIAFDAFPQVANAVFTVNNVFGLSVRSGSKGASATATNWHGIQVADQTQGTNNYGITSLVSSGTNKWNIYASGTAANYFAGNVGIGTSSPQAVLEVRGTSPIRASRDAQITLSGTGFGHYVFAARYDASNYIEGASIVAISNAAWSASSIPTYLSFRTGGTTSGSLVERLLLGNTATVFNDTGEDVDFRVESDTNTHALFVQGSDGFVGIGTNTPNYLLDVRNASGGATINVQASTGNAAFRAISLASGSAQLLLISFPGTQSIVGGVGSVNNMVFSVDSTERFRLSTTEAVFNDPGNDYDFRVESDTNTHALFVQGSDGNVGIGTSSPSNELEVYGTGSPRMAIRAPESISETPELGFQFGTGANSSANVLALLRAIPTQVDPSALKADLAFLTNAGDNATERLRITSAGNVSIGGNVDRATTVGTNALNIFDGTAPVGTLANGISLYSSSGEAYVMDAAGNATLFSPHDAETNEWIFKSKHTPSGKVLKIDVEKMLRFINDHFGLDAIHEFTEE